MVLRLCQHIQEFLHAHNKPPSKSFYEEMLYNRQLQEQKQAREAEKRLELERQREHKQVADNLLIAFVFMFGIIFSVNFSTGIYFSLLLCSVTSIKYIHIHIYIYKYYMYINDGYFIVFIAIR